MLSSLEPEIKALIIDLDGVLWKDHEPIGNLPAIFSRISVHGWQFAFATNNSMNTPEFYRKKLADFGVQLHNPIIVTSPLAVAFALKKRYPAGGAVHIVGEKGLRETLQQAGFVDTDGKPLAVVAGMDRSITYAKLKKAARLIRDGVWFIGSNPDKTYPTPEGLAPGAGSILAALEAASGVSPMIVGKPSPTLFEAAREQLGSRPEETLVIGDRLDTDILGGQRAGMKTALVLSGVTSQDELEKWQPKPDLVAPSLAVLIG